MSYQVIARKWRPLKFADVVGQKHIIRTIQNELLQEKTAHAYLFVGPRGIGKTTIARIFAKAMNCERAPIAEPCCECQSCLDISNNNSLDLIEIDGASNNSVNDIRQLREEVLYAPVNNKYKIYIIDEVHMLSTSAWNALLKTIEEPPAHAKFLFATTEAHKVLPTVISRCQRFDLQRIAFNDITDQLKKIAQAENVKIDQEAVEIIARAADGGMRDAQSLLDQMIAFASAESSSITAQQVLSIFGFTGIEELRVLVNALINNDRKQVMLSVHHLSRGGKNLEKLLNDVLAYLRGVLIVQTVDDPGMILETGDEMISIYQSTAQNIKPITVQKLLEFLSPIGRSLHDALNKQVFLETIFFKAMRLAHALEVEELIVRLQALRKGGDLSSLDKFPSVELKREMLPTPMPQSGKVIAEASTVQASQATSQKQETASVQSGDNLSKLSTETSEEKKNEQIKELSTSIINNLESKVLESKPQNVENLSQKPIYVPQKVSDLKPEINEPSPEQALSDTQIFLLENPKEAKKPEIGKTAEELWHLLIQDMGVCNQPLLKQYMSAGRVESLKNNVLTVVFDEDSPVINAKEVQKNSKLLETRMKLLANGVAVSLNIVYKEEVVSPHEVTHDNKIDFAELKHKVEKNNFVRDTMKLFDAEVVDVKG